MKPYIAIAPMEGVVDWILRDVLTSFGGIDRTVTEFIRVTDQRLSETTFYRYCPELKNGSKTSSGVPVFIQLLGGKPYWLAENAQLAEHLGAPGIDLNFGCPAKTVNRHDGGAVILKTPHRIFEIVSAVKQAVKIPVTAKVRLGFEHKDFHIDIAKAAEEGGADLLTVHARTKLEGYQPPAHWEYIANMRENIKIPVVANGEIWNFDDFKRCREVTGCSGFALGRGLVARPDLAAQIALQTAPKTWDDIQELYVLSFFERCLSARGDAFAVTRIKQLLRYLSRNFQEALILFNAVKLLSEANDVRIRLEAICPKINRPAKNHMSNCTPGLIAPSAFALKTY